jgi:hypothetical protein
MLGGAGAADAVVFSRSMRWSLSDTSDLCSSHALGLGATDQRSSSLPSTRGRKTPIQHLTRHGLPSSVLFGKRGAANASVSRILLPAFALWLVHANIQDMRATVERQALDGPYAQLCGKCACGPRRPRGGFNSRGGEVTGVSLAGGLAGDALPGGCVPRKSAQTKRAGRLKQARRQREGRRQQADRCPLQQPGSVEAAPLPERPAPKGSRTKKLRSKPPGLKI